MANLILSQISTLVDYYSKDTMLGRSMAIYIMQIQNMVMKESILYKSL